MTDEVVRPLRRTGAPTRVAEMPEHRRLRLVIDSVPAMVAYWDADLRNVLANEAYLEWFGVTQEQVREMTLSELLGDEVLALNRPHIEGVLRGEPQQFDRTLVDAAGRTRHTQAVYVPDIVDDTVAGFFVLVTDTTTTIEAQRDLDEAQRLTEVGSWTWSPDDRAVHLSPEVYRITGAVAPGPEPISEGFVGRVHPDDLDAVIAAREHVLSTGADLEIGYRIVRPDGEIRNVHCRVVVDRFEAGRATQLHGTIQDVTERERAVRELSHANAELARAATLQVDLLTVLGRDARQLVGTLRELLVRMATEWAAMPDDRKLADVRAGLAATLGLRQLLDDVVSMTHVETGNLAGHPASTPVAQTVAQALTNTAAGSVVQTVVTGTPVAYVDPTHLRQIVTNLVANAVRYGRPPVVVWIGERGDTVEIEVADSGAGLDAATVRELFRRSLDAESASTAVEGPGLGLYVARRLAETNGGRVDYLPNEPSGSRFLVTLPSLGKHVF